MEPNTFNGTRPHFLVITFPAQGHLNPALHLAKRLASSTTARVTFSTAAAAHRRMFPLSSQSSIISGNITYIPFSDGSSPHNPNTNNNTDDLRSFVSQIKRLGSDHFAAILNDLNAAGNPVTCVIYTIMLQWAGDVACRLGIPSALYWIQSATVLSIYHHFFNNFEPLIAANAKDPSFTVSFPSLPVFQIKDLPSLLTITSPDEPFYDILLSLRQVFEALSRKRQQFGEKPVVLVNSFDELEREVLSSMAEFMDLVTVGPVMPWEEEGGVAASADMFDQSEKEYMEWLDKQEEGSVVYVAFGSVHKLSKEEMEEIGRGLKESERPFLWVVRKDSRLEGVELEDGKQGMVVEWCSQVKVLGHKAVGCFVTHGGWNSTVEGLVAGVAAVVVPTWSDQGTNAWMMERVWGTAVRAEGSDGRVSGEDLRRCLEIVMGGVEIRRKVEMWKEKAREAIGDGGSSCRNLKAFGSRR